MPEFDVLVIGGGASGLRAAIAAKHAGANVALITKTHPLRTNSAVAQGGLNAPLGKDDSPESFAGDTLTAGDGLCDRAVVQAFVQDAAKDVIWLERMGVPFNRDNQGKLDRRGFGSNSHNERATRMIEPVTWCCRYSTSSFNAGKSLHSKSGSSLPWSSMAETVWELPR